MTSWFIVALALLSQSAARTPDAVAPPPARHPLAAAGLPAQDPPANGAPVALLPTAAGQHPRLLLNAQRLPQLRAFWASPAAQAYREQVLAYLPACVPPAQPKFQTDATDGQRQGLWRLPTVALHALLTGDAASLQRAVAYLKLLDSLPDWETGAERNSGMSAANVMIGAALAYDWLWDKLDPAFREQFRHTLWQHARELYHLGHRMGNPGNHYWQGDPFNNHRWHRDAGLLLAVLAAYDGAPEDQWLLQRAAEEVRAITDGLPSDGSSHESSTYLTFGGPHLVLACQAADECLGTHYLELPFFRQVARFRLALLAPGGHDSLHYGDSGGVGGYNAFLLKTAAVNHDADALAALRAWANAEPKAFDFGWWQLLWDDPAQTGGQPERLPTTSLFPDLGLATLRENWSAQATAAMFKCGPLGGYKLNEFRAAHDMRYVNVAHDDPDANSFVIFGQGEYLAETDRYSADKRSSNYNTVLVNGLGQMAKGRPEGQVFSQPGAGDMSEMAKLVAWKDAGEVVVAEGEAAGSYLAYTDRKTQRSRPALQRFRRTFIWVKGSYVLVLDDLRAPQPVDFTWLVQGAKLSAVDAASGRYKLAKGKAACDFQLLADTAFSATVATSTADDRRKPLGWQQLQAGVHGPAVRFAAVFDPWAHGDLRLTLKTDGPDALTVTVTGQGFTDTWRQQAATGRFVASTLKGSRAGGFAVTVDAATAAPPAP